MMDERTRQREFEALFLRQLRARAESLLLRGLPANRVGVAPVPDGADALRATLERVGRYDRELLSNLPGGQAIQLTFFRRVAGFFSSAVARLRAQTLANTEALIADETPGPVDRDRVLDALARYDLLPRRARPTAAVFASATGFTAEARALVHNTSTPTLILMGLRPDGGWDVELPAKLHESGWVKLFEFETQDDRLRRLLYHLDENADLLDSRGVPLADLAASLGLPRDAVRPLVHQACRQDSRLMTVTHQGQLHICRSPLAEEGSDMTWWSRVRRWLRLKPSVAEQVRELTAQRVRLEQQRHELDERVERLEAGERDTVQKGAAAKTDVERKQLAGKLARNRRELQRVRAQTNVLSQQIDILGTHVHHLTLAQQGKQVTLPKAEDLTREAAQAEQIMSELAANADLAHSIEVGARSPGMDDEEQAILAEFAQAAAEQSATAPQSATDAARADAASGEALRPPAAGEKSRTDESARPEMG